MTRRQFACGAATAAAGWILAGCGQRRLYEMPRERIRAAMAELESRYRQRLGVDISVSDTPAPPNVEFAYALDISRCIGCRRCVYACVAENNQSRDPQMHWIRVFEFKREDTIRWINFEKGTPFFDHGLQPARDKVYLPVACMQCENPECVRACPTNATWKDKDGIVVIDYNWCIGCRYCMTACPYGARYFNWTEPKIPKDEINPNVHYLGNRPRMGGVVEKCTFCIHRTRKGRYPACVEACPVGARKFGNFLDPDSEIQQLLKHKRTFVLKAEIGTKPKFFYFYSFYG